MELSYLIYANKKKFKLPEYFFSPNASYDIHLNK